MYEVKVLIASSCLTLYDPWTIYSLPGSSVHGILQARILQLVTIPFSRGSSWPRDWTPALQADSWTIWATRAALLCVYVVVTIDRKFVIDAHRKERKESKHHTKDSNHITRGENKRWRVNKNYQNNQKINNKMLISTCCCFSCKAVSDSLQPHGL